jgi:hypothetical protein
MAGHRHSGIPHLSSVPEHSGTGLVLASAFFFIPVHDRMLDSPAFQHKIFFV